MPFSMPMGSKWSRRGSVVPHQHANDHTKQKLHTSHTSHSLHSHARDVRRIPRSQTRFRVATPRVNPGSEPVQPPRQTGVWTVEDTQTQSVIQLFHGPAPRSPLHRLAVRLRHSRSNTRHNTYIQARRLRRHEELMIHMMIHRIRRATQPGVGEVIIELEAPGRWRWRRGRQGAKRPRALFPRFGGLRSEICRLAPCIVVHSLANTA